ncbi:MAG: SAM-dependent methyltransferase [Jatrophihabitantaceae bacterium]
MRSPLLDRLLPRELHTTDRPSETAQWTTLARALELRRPKDQRIVSDPYAPLFLTQPNQRILRTLRHGSALLTIAERNEFAALSTFSLCRHRFIDEQLRLALAEGVEQVVILGAGYDSRAYRFADELAGRPVHEVDLAPLSRRKAGIVAANPHLFAGTAIRRVEIDFRVDALAERLLAAGFAVGVRTFVVWEGVSMYLTGAAVGTTLDTLADICGPGSVLTMDLFHDISGLRPIDRLRRAGVRAIRLIGEPITFALTPKQAPGFLHTHGFEASTVMQSDALAAHYSTDRRPCDRSVYVLAARRR